MTDQQVWDLYFASIAGWAFHPGNARELKETKDHIELAAFIADQMLEIRKRRWQQ